MRRLCATRKKRATLLRRRRHRRSVVFEMPPSLDRILVDHDQWRQGRNQTRVSAAMPCHEFIFLPHLGVHMFEEPPSGARSRGRVKRAVLSEHCQEAAIRCLQRLWHGNRQGDAGEKVMDAGRDATAMGIGIIAGTGVCTVGAGCCPAPTRRIAMAKNGLKSRLSPPWRLGE
jgi:hypothetical protein